MNAAAFDGALARPIPGHTLYDLIRRSEVEKTPLTELASTMAATHKEAAPAIILLSPPPAHAVLGLRLHL